VTLIAIASPENELCLVANSANGATGEKAKRCCAARHARKISDKNMLDFPALLAVWIVRPQVKPFYDVRRSDEKRIAHSRAARYFEERFPQSDPVSCQSLLESFGIVEC